MVQQKQCTVIIKQNRRRDKEEMMSGDGVGGQNNVTDQVVNMKNQEAEQDKQIAKEEKDKCIILYCNLKIVWNI